MFGINNRWRSEEDALLRELWTQDNISATEIAAKLTPPRSKNAVVGRAHRLGLPKKRPSRYHAPTNAGQPRPRRVRTKYITIPDLPMLPLAPPVVPCSHNPLRVSLLDVKSGQCRAIIESSAATIATYCGHDFPIDRKFSYCDYHMSVYMRR